MTAVSVVLAVYNGARFLRPQLDSVLAQLRPGDELIVVDDASTDESLAIVKATGSALLKVHASPANRGVLASFEQGLRLATHEVVFLCDQDDLWLPGKRDAFVGAFERDPGVLVVISDAQVIDANGVIVAPSFMAGRQGFAGSVVATLWRNRYLGCAMALRRRLLSLALPVPPGVPMHDMWFGALGRLAGRVVYLSTPYLQYRRHGGNVTPSRRQGAGQMLRWRWALLRALAGRWLAVRLRRHRSMAGEGA